jgi:hypothetical protein
MMSSVTEHLPQMKRVTHDGEKRAVVRLTDGETTRQNGSHMRLTTPRQRLATSASQMSLCRSSIVK